MIILRHRKDIAKDLAARAKQLRINRNWSQREMSHRTGIALATYIRFERTGKGSLDLVLRIAEVTGKMDQFLGIFQEELPMTIRQLELIMAQKARKRGRTRSKAVAA